MVFYISKEFKIVILDVNRSSFLESNSLKKKTCYFQIQFLWLDFLMANSVEKPPEKMKGKHF